MYIAGQYAGLGLGDQSAEIVKIKAHMKRKYTPARNTLDDGPLFTPAMEAEVRREQLVFLKDGRLAANKYVPGVVNLAMKYAMGYLSLSKLLPLYFSAEGHMSDMWVGPVAWCGEVLRHEGRALHYPTYYTNNAIPFKTQTGINEMARRIGQTVQDDGVEFPAGTPFVLGGFSEGAMVTYGVYTQFLAPGKPLHWRLKDLRGVLSAGSPHREKGVVAEWIPDPPTPDRQGLSDERMINTPSWWKEIARQGDLYTDNQSEGERALYKTMCYKLVAKGSFSGGPPGFLARVMDLLSPTDDLIPVALAIYDGMRFAVNMSPHGVYNMDPAVQFLRERLSTA